MQLLLDIYNMHKYSVHGTAEASGTNSGEMWHMKRWMGMDSLVYVPLFLVLAMHTMGQKTESILVGRAKRRIELKLVQQHPDVPIDGRVGEGLFEDCGGDVVALVPQNLFQVNSRTLNRTA